MMFSFGKERRFTHFPMMYEENTYSQYEQELWDKVAVQAIPALLETSQEWTSDEEASAPMESWADIAKGAAQLADAFMAERAKRMKERA